MTPSIRNILVDFIISNNEINGHPAVKTAEKGELTRYLTHVLVNDVTLTKHCGFLKQFKFDRPQLDPSTVNSIPNTGLDCLNNEEIAILSLDCIALQDLYAAIDDKTPDQWVSAINREGLKHVSVENHQDDD